MLVLVVVLVNRICRIEDEDEQESLTKRELVRFTSRVAGVNFVHVDLRGTSEECVKSREVSGLHSRHRFIRIGKIDPDR